MINPITKYQYISELEYNNLLSAYKSKVRQNERLSAEVQRLLLLINQLNDNVATAKNEATNYREMYQSLREGKYLLIPK